ncbi:MAG: ammonium transporter [Rhodospirillales bacterium]|nr:ammonium transporter [Rhodospirillales bacterium]
MDNNVTGLTVIFTELYYWLTVVIMFLIHVGFVTYEVGVSRRKNHLATLMKNTMVIPVVGVTFYLFGWWFYSSMVNGPGITGGLVDAPFAEPWSELMGAHIGGTPVDPSLTDANSPATWARLNGVFWAAFLLFSWTTASIVSGAVIERIRMGAFWLIAVMLGSVTWIIDAAWGWHYAGWMVQLLGYHDAYASGVVHAIAGGTALAVLINLGPRIGRFRPDGTARNIPPQNTWLVCIGLFLIYTGFWGFYAACNIPIFDVQAGDGVFYSATNIYLQPTTLSAITFNFLMALSGGLMAAYVVSKGDPFWTFSGGLAGVIATSAGNDLYHPIQAMLISAVIVVIVYKMHYWVERRFKIDDAVGAVAVHGYAGFLGVVAVGFVMWGYPSSPDAILGHEEPWARITPWGQFIGAVIMFFVLGFIPGYVLSWILKVFGLLRVPREVELAGLDHEMQLVAAREGDEIRTVLLQEGRATAAAE